MKELRYASRRLFNKSAPHYRIVMVLGLGIGVASTLFGVLYQIMFRPFDIVDPERVVAVSGNASPPAGDPLAYWSQASSMEALGIFSVRSVTAEWLDQAKPVTVAAVSTSLFDVLQSKPVLGRLFNDQTPADDTMILLSERTWTTQFGRATNVVGQQIRLGRSIYTVGGVVSAKAAFPPAIDLWIPRSRSQQSQWTNEEAVSGLPSNMRSGYLGLLRHGVSAAQARQELTAKLKALTDTYSARLNLRFGDEVFVTPLRERYSVNMRATAIALSLAGGLLLAIVVANSVGLLLVDGLRRRHEVVVRVSIGASRRAIVRQALIETVCLALASGAVSVLVSNLALKAIRHVSSDMVRTAVEDVEPILAGGALVAAFAIGVAMSIPPALQALGTDVAAWLGGRRQALRPQRWLALLIGAEIAIALMLLIVEGTTIQSLTELAGIRTGFDSDNVIVSELDFGHFMPRATSLEISGHQNGSKVHEREVEESRLDRYIAAQHRTLKKVSEGWRIEAALVDAAPFGKARLPRLSLKVQDEFRMAEVFTIAGGYFSQMGIPILAGRPLNELDRAGAGPVIVINRALATRFGPGGEAIGKSVEIEGEDFVRRVVGVVGPVKTAMVDETAAWQCYLPAAQPFRGLVPGSKLSLVVNRLNTPYGDQVERMLRERLSGFGAVEIYWLKGRVERTRAQTEMMAGLFGAISVLALALAAVGVYTVVSLAVASRGQELAIRTALGATNNDLLRLVLADIKPLLFLGVLAGVAGSLWSDRLLGTFMAGGRATDALTILVAVAVVCVSVGFAVVRPVLNASKAEPASSLRTT